MLTENDKKEFDKACDELDKLDGLSLFQIAFMKDIKFYILQQGSYKYLENFVMNKYKEIDTPEVLKEEIEILIDYGLVIKKVKRTIYNGRYSTIITMTLK